MIDIFGVPIPRYKLVDYQQLSHDTPLSYVFCALGVVLVSMSYNHAFLIHVGEDSSTCT